VVLASRTFGLKPYHLAQITERVEAGVARHGRKTANSVAT
jgi:hypothetical protein